MDNFAEKLEALLREATPGPWTARTVERYGGSHYGTLAPTEWYENNGARRLRGKQSTIKCVISGSVRANTVDLDLIAYLRNHAPALLALVKAVQKAEQASEMEAHNEAIFKGPWKKGSKAWSGEFIERLRRESKDELRQALRGLE